MICSKCGKTIADGAKFCTYCGAVQSGSSGGGAYRSGGDAYSRGGGDAFGSRGSAFDDRGRGRDAFGSRGDAFGGRSRGGDAFGGAPRRGGDAFGGAPRRGGGDAFGSRSGSFGGGYRDDFSRPARRDGEANFILLLIGAILALAGGILRLCMNIPWKDDLKNAWAGSGLVESVSKEAGIYAKAMTMTVIMYHVLPGLLMILFAIMIITKGKRRPTAAGSSAVMIPVVEFLLLNVVFIWTVALASNGSGGGDIFGDAIVFDVVVFLIPLIMELVFGIVYSRRAGKLARGKRTFLWSVPIVGVAAFIYMLMIHLIYHGEGIGSGLDFLKMFVRLLGTSGGGFMGLNLKIGRLEMEPMYLISFALFFAGASVAVFGFPRNGGRLPGPGRDSRDPYARAGRDSFGRY